LNIANPSTGLQKSIEIDDDKKLLPFFEKRMGSEVPGDSLGEEFKGYIFKITGGNDKEGFPMMQGVLCANRVRLLFKEGMPCFRLRRKGQSKRRSVRGCIVGPDLKTLCLVVAKKGEGDIPELTDGDKPRRLGPKRAGKIRKMFNLSKDDDVRKFVIRRVITPKTPKMQTKTKAPKIQRLVTPQRLQRKRRLAAVKRHRIEAANEAREEYNKMMEAYKADKTKPTKGKTRKVSVSAASGGGSAPAATPASAPKAGKAAPKAAAPKAAAPKAAAPKAAAPKAAAPKVTGKSGPKLK